MPVQLVYGHHLISCREFPSALGSVIFTLTLQMRELKSKNIIELPQATKLLHLMMEFTHLCVQSDVLIQDSSSSPFLYFSFHPIFSKQKPPERLSTFLGFSFLVYLVGTLMSSISKPIIQTPCPGTSYCQGRQKMHAYIYTYTCMYACIYI